MNETYLNGLFGILATLCGVFITSLIYEYNQKIKTKKEISEFFKLIYNDICHQKDRISQEKTVIIDCSTYEVAKIKGVICSLDTKLSLSIIEIFNLFQEYNNQVKNYNTFLSSAISANQIEKFSYSVPGYNKNIEEVKAKIFEKVTSFLNDYKKLA